MGNTCKPMAVSFQCMTKSTTNKKKIKKKDRSASLQGSTTRTWMWKLRSLLRPHFENHTESFPLHFLFKARHGTTQIPGGEIGFIFLYPERWYKIVPFFTQLLFTEDTITQKLKAGSLKSGYLGFNPSSSQLYQLYYLPQWATWVFYGILLTECLRKIPGILKSTQWLFTSIFIY